MTRTPAQAGFIQAESVRAGSIQGSPEKAARQFEESVASIVQALASLKFGNVSVTVHEGRVVQIDVTEKKRLRLD